MDILQIVLRVLHIGANIAWMGFGAYGALIMTPAMRSAVVDGSKAWGWIYNNSPYVPVMLVAPFLSLVTGLWLYWEVSDGFYDEYMGSTSGIILSTGVLAGIAAWGHGGATMGRNAGKVRNLTKTITTGGELTAQQLQEFEELEAYQQKHAYISLGLMVVALVTMTTHPYWG